MTSGHKRDEFVVVGFHFGIHFFVASERLRVAGGRLRVAVRQKLLRAEAGFRAFLEHASLINKRSRNGCFFFVGMLETSFLGFSYSQRRLCVATESHGS